MNGTIKKIINSNLLDGKDFNYYKNNTAEALQVGFLYFSYWYENGVYKIINTNNNKQYFIGNVAKEAFNSFRELIKGLK